ncbi:MAG: precorrin-2 C(20)-methyltransferase [Actinomycetota bacterium]|nr:precorrin-2 C(20)-methyltransferase [Actinomycetota bacterium]
MSGRLVGVGVGPGDPDLLTIKGREALRRADVVFVPVAAGGGPSEEHGLGYAERVVRTHVPHSTSVRRLAFDLDPSKREATWNAAAEVVAAVVREGDTAAFATIGDPNVYSTFSRIAEAVRALAPDTKIETVPGITAMQDLAARSGITLVEGDERLALLPFTAGEDALRQALDRFETVVCYKGGRRLADVLRVVREADRIDQLVYGAGLGLTGEEIRRAPFLPRGPGPYLSTVIVTAP